LCSSEMRVPNSGLPAEQCTPDSQVCWRLSMQRHAAARQHAAAVRERQQAAQHHGMCVRRQ
jgi:hypothetical protein